MYISTEFFDYLRLINTLFYYLPSTLRYLISVAYSLSAAFIFDARYLQPTFAGKLKLPSQLRVAQVKGYQTLPA